MRRTTTKFALVIVLLIVVAYIGLRQGVPAQSRPTIATEADFQRALKDVSNWGRWGKDDEMGSSNLITPAKRKQAAALVKEGISVSLAHDVVEEAAPDATTVLNRTLLNVSATGSADRYQ